MRWAGSGPRHDIVASGAFDRPLTVATVVRCAAQQVSAADDARRGGALVRRGPGATVGQGDSLPTEGEEPQGSVVKNPPQETFEGGGDIIEVMRLACR